jgi:hypothetical protein
VGDDRSIYRVGDDALKVLLAEMGHRREVNRSL